MKKILRNIFLCILALIVAAAGGVWYTLFGVSEKPVEVDSTAVSTTSNYTGPNIDVEINPEDYTGAVVTTNPTTKGTAESTTSGNNEKPGSTTTTAASSADDPFRLEAFRIKQYHKAISDGTFLMETTMEDP